MRSKVEEREVCILFYGTRLFSSTFVFHRYKLHLLQAQQLRAHSLCDVSIERSTKINNKLLHFFLSNLFVSFLCSDVATLEIRQTYAPPYV